MRRPRARHRVAHRRRGLAGRTAAWCDARGRRLRLRPAGRRARPRRRGTATTASSPPATGATPPREALGARRRHRDQGVRARRGAPVPAGAAAVLDIGGQDTKVISLGAGGRVARLRDERQVRRRHRQVPRGDGAGARLRARGDGRRPRWRRRRRRDDLVDVHGLRRERGHRAGAPRRGPRAHRARAARVDRTADALVTPPRGRRAAARLRRGRRPQWSPSWSPSPPGRGAKAEILVAPDPQIVGALGAALHALRD